MKLDAGGQRAIKTVASDGVGIDRGRSRGVSSAATMTPAVAGAALPSRWLIEQRRQAHRALNEHMVMALAPLAVRGSSDRA
jgi:hypothetical protein